MADENREHTPLLLVSAQRLPRFACHKPDNRPWNVDNCAIRARLGRVHPHRTIQRLQQPRQVLLRAGALLGCSRHERDVSQELHDRTGGLHEFLPCASVLALRIRHDRFPDLHRQGAPTRRCVVGVVWRVVELALAPRRVREVPGQLLVDNLHHRQLRPTARTLGPEDGERLRAARRHTSPHAAGGGADRAPGVFREQHEHTPLLLKPAQV
mmetsp:Transcript_48860/g.157822  ORF Transcript_48860/g.157822 Transcript_48860/m.157822 type:complete len:211 (+) Transcript_48860:1139-1771(+)